MNQNPNVRRNYGPSVNTGVGTLYSDAGRLKIGAWNDRLTLDYSPRIIGPSGNQTFSDENSVKVTITQEEAIRMYHAITGGSVDLNTPGHKVGVLIGYGDKRKGIEIGSDDASNKYIKIYPYILPTGEIDKSKGVLFRFSKNVYYIDSDLDEPEAILENVDSDFKYFTYRLNEFINNTAYHAHVIKYSDTLRTALRHNNSGSQGQNFIPQNNNGTANNIDYAQSNFDFITPDSMNPEDLPF